MRVRRFGSEEDRRQGHGEPKAAAAAAVVK
jgi:hypothetical protein